MAVPVLQFTGIQVFTVSPVHPYLCIAVVSGAPITAWRWLVTETPLFLQDANDDNGGFNNRVALTQDPQWFCFLPGDYKMTVQAQNADGWCLPIDIQFHCSRGDCANMRYWQP